MNTITVLKKARALVARKHGWIKNHYSAYRTPAGILLFGRRRNCFCVTGAIDWVTGIHVAAQIDAEREMLKTVGRGRSLTLETWNDRRWRTQAQVVRAFDKTIARLAGSASR